MRSLLHAIELPNLVKCVDAGGETTVQAEDLGLDDSRQWQVIEQLGELFPHVRVTVLTQTLIIETIPTL